MADVRMRSVLGVGVAALCLSLTQPTAVFAEDVPSTDTVFDLERDLSDCISAYPPPNCGRKPTSSGDRGGAMQYATFGAIVAGLSVIFTVVFRNTIRADKKKSENLPENTPGYF